MAKKERRSHAHRERAAVGERARRSRLAYHGTKYQTEELIETLFRAEVGIYESFVMSDHCLIDQDVTSALTSLIDELRRPALADLQDTMVAPDTHDEELVLWCIRRQWQELYAEQPEPDIAKQVGVLRTILGSVEVWSSPGPQSQGFLKYLEGFLTHKMGVSVHRCDQNLVPIPDPEPDDLLRLGRAWAVEGDTSVVDSFCDLAEGMLADNRASELAETCQQLIGEARDYQTIADLSRFSMAAQRCMVAAMG
jgi:hypothetical protein